MIPALTHWESFYVIVGSSAAALTGLQFVVIALVADSPIRVSTSTRTIAAFASPTIVHFCASLLIASILSAPWTSLVSVAVAMKVIGLAGLLYDVVVIRRAMRQESYRPELSDWIWHNLLPILAHGVILVASFLLYGGSELPLFLLGAASLFLLFIGIHNAWDTVTYIAISRPEAQAAQAAAASEREAAKP